MVTISNNLYNVEQTIILDCIYCINKYSSLIKKKKTNLKSFNRYFKCFGINSRLTSEKLAEFNYYPRWQTLNLSPRQSVLLSNFQNIYIYV